MKRWAVLTVLLYAVALIVLTVPTLLVTFGGWAKNSIGWLNALNFYSYLGYWIWLVVLAGGQMLLLLVPIDVSEKRLPSRRKLKVPVIVTAFLLANLFAAGIFSALCAIFTDNAFSVFSFTDWILGHRVANQPGTVQTTGGGVWTSIFIVVGICWVIWAAVFSRFSKTDDADSLLKRAVRWLLRGSILELLIAVPSHVIARRRDDCCAPAGTFWGIATGISIMLLCFGPGVFFLFVERLNRLKPKPTEGGK